MSRAVAMSAIVGLAALWMAPWLWRSRYLYEWDSAQYALGTLRFDVREHRPHPPGYPLWIVLLKATHVFIRDLNTAQIALGFAVTSVAALLLYRLSRSLDGPVAALLGASLLLFSPTVIFCGAIASSYPADLLTSTLLGALSARLWLGDKRCGHWTALALALLAGVRQSGAVLMAPLVGVALLRAHGLDLRRWATSGLVGIAALASWYIPTERMSGGMAAYRSMTRSQVLGSIQTSSVFFGAPLRQHLTMLRMNATWAVAAVAIATATTATLSISGWLAARSVPRAPVTPRFGRAFFALWMVPNLLSVTLLHSFKPGYLFIDLPPSMLLAARFAAPALVRLGGRLRGGAMSVAAVASLIAALAGTALAHCRHDETWNRTTLASVRDSDDDARAIEDLVSSGPGPAGTLVMVLSCGPYGPNVRSLAVQLPDTRVALLAPDGAYGLLRQFWHDEFIQDESEAKAIAPTTRRILWLHERNGAVLQSIRESFPGTHVVLYGKTIKALESDLGDEPVDAYVNLDRKYDLVRAEAPAGVSLPGASSGAE